MKRLFGPWHPRRGLQIGLLMGVVAGTTATAPLQAASADAIRAGDAPGVSSTPSYNWAGYAAGPGPRPFGSVWATWDAPPMDNCRNDPQPYPLSGVDMWVGMEGWNPDGTGSPGFEKIGLSVACAGNTSVSYYPVFSTASPPGSLLGGIPAKPSK